jgi:transposase InsO family protein
MCALAKVSRAGFYRFTSPRSGGDAEAELRDAMQRIALEFPSYGWTRMTEELKRRGWTVNHKRVYRLMREDNLLCLRRRKFVVTTDSAHPLPVYPNLARQMKLTGLDQLWVADITYIRLRTEFVYLAVILDAFSRRVIGWALDRTLEDTLTLRALRMALEQRRPAPGFVHLDLSPHGPPLVRPKLAKDCARVLVLVNHLINGVPQVSLENGLEGFW